MSADVDPMQSAVDHMTKAVETLDVAELYAEEASAVLAALDRLAAAEAQAVEFQRQRDAGSLPRLDRALKAERRLAAAEAQRDTLLKEREWWTAVNKELLPYQERAVTAEAQRDTLAEALPVLLKVALDEGYGSDPDYPEVREAIYQAQIALAAVTPTEAKP